MTKTKVVNPSMERQPVILSLLMFKKMGIVEEEHPRLEGEWAVLWEALSDYRDSLSEGDWTMELFELMCTPPEKMPKKYAGPAWDKVNHQLNVIWTKAKEAS